MKFFDIDIVCMDYDDWIKKHYDCPVKEIVSCDGGMIITSQFCTRHRQTFMNAMESE